MHAGLPVHIAYQPEFVICYYALCEKLVSKLFIGDHLTLKIVIGLLYLAPQFLVQCMLTYPS
jgi:hypothetical protein